MHILFIEDQIEIREETTEVLARLGHTVVAVDKAEKALVELGRGTFDLILTDNDTESEICGLDVVKKIRTDLFFQEIKNIPVVIQSGDAIEKEAHALNTTLLPKPWGRAQLKAALDTAVLQQTGSLFRI